MPCVPQYCSLPQKEELPPEDDEEAPTQAVRTIDEERQFRIAMWEMSRLYAFSHCEVIVLPDLDDNMSAWPREDQMYSAPNDTPYKNRGWQVTQGSHSFEHAARHELIG